MRYLRTVLVFATFGWGAIVARRVGALGERSSVHRHVTVHCRACDVTLPTYKLLLVPPSAYIELLAKQIHQMAPLVGE